MRSAFYKSGIIKIFQEFISCRGGALLFGVSQNQMPFGQLFFYFKAVQSFFSLLQDKVRHKGDPKADVRQIKKQVITGQFHLRCEIQAFLEKEAVQKLTGSALFAEHEEGVPVQFSQGQFPVRKVKIMLICGKDIPEGQDCLVVFFYPKP